MVKDSNDQPGLVKVIQAKPVMNEEFLRFYSTYPEHRRMDVLDAERAWNNAALTNEEVIVLLEWLRERQEEDPSWHPRAMGMYVPKLDSFLKKRWWLSPKAHRRP